MKVYKESNNGFLEIKWYVYNDNNKLLSCGWTKRGAIKSAKREILKQMILVEEVKFEPKR
jgi:hypothetical protein